MHGKCGRKWAAPAAPGRLVSSHGAHVSSIPSARYPRTLREPRVCRGDPLAHEAITRPGLQELARTGLTPVHVNRMVEALRKDDLIELRDRRLHRLEPALLRGIATFNPAFLHL